ncbi:hypothetical protein GO499_15685 [Algicella marina]|uniref:Uncharacterized protein n=1 Tax=Algicella marina TaxID=2683284 RepID=A0A6P1T3Y3_9RHOB|nr:hypothetical protein GO499_15685 [Algicella marina]
MLGGTAPFGRLALSLGLPGLAAHAFDDPAWQGVAQYRAGYFAQADESFRTGGMATAFNRGNAAAMEGRYAAALEAYDIALLANPADEEAQANFDLVRAFYAGTAVSAEAPVKWFEDKEGDEVVAADVAQGTARAAGGGDGITNAAPLLGLPELQSTGEARVRKVFDDKFVVANERWLATLEDVPGTYLAERIKHEYKRRKAAGIGQPEAEEPW